MRVLERSLSDDVWGRCGFSTPTSPNDLEAAFIADTRWSEWKRRAGEIALSKTKTAQDLARDLRQLGPHSTIAEIRRVLLTADGEPRKFRGANFSTTAQDWVSSEQARMIRLDGQLKGACIAQDTVHALTLAIGYIELFEGAKNERERARFRRPGRAGEGSAHRKGRRGLGALQARRRDRPRPAGRGAGHRARAMGRAARAYRGVLRRQGRGRRSADPVRGRRREAVDLLLPGRRARAAGRSRRRASATPSPRPGSCSRSPSSWRAAARPRKSWRSSTRSSPTPRW